MTYKEIGGTLMGIWLVTWFLAIWINQYRVQLLLTGGFSFLLALLNAYFEAESEIHQEG